MSSQPHFAIVEDTRVNRPRSGLFLMSWAHFLNDGSANYLPGILPAVLVALREPPAMAGVLMAALLIGQALQPFTGLLSDRVGGKAIFIIGLAGSSVGGALLGFSGNFGLLVVFLFVIGLGNALFHPQALAIVRGMVRSKGQGLSMSTFLVGGELGRGVFPVVTSWIVSAFGLVNLWFVAIPAVLTIPLIVRRSPGLPKRQRNHNRILWRKHIRGSAVLISFAALRSLMSYGVVTFLPILWHERGGALVSGASIITTILVVGIAGNLAGGHLADRLGRKVLLLTSSIASAVLLPFLAITTGPWLWGVAGLLGIALFSSAPVTVLLGQDLFPENRSLGSGMALGLSNGVGAVLVFCMGLLVGGFGVEHVLEWIAFAGVIATGLVFFLPREIMLGGGGAHD